MDLKNLDTIEKCKFIRGDTMALVTIGSGPQPCLRQQQDSWSEQTDPQKITKHPENNTAVFNNMDQPALLPGSQMRGDSKKGKTYNELGKTNNRPCKFDLCHCNSLNTETLLIGFNANCVDNNNGKPLLLHHFN